MSSTNSILLEKQLCSLIMRRLQDFLTGQMQCILGLYSWHVLTVLIRY